MWASTRTVSLQGAVGHVIDVQVDVSQGQIATNLVGRADASINEARDRCRSAIHNSGYDWPTSRRITVLLSPADLPKSGTHFDLAIAVAVLAAGGAEFPRRALDDVVLIGELTLDGRLRCVPGVLPMVMAASTRGRTRVVVPEPQMQEASLVTGVEVYGVRSLGQVVALLQGDPEIPEAPPVEPPTGDLLLSWRGEARLEEVDLSEVQGMTDARYALEVAAVGGHHLMFTGPKKKVPTGKQPHPCAYTTAGTPVPSRASLRATETDSVYMHSVCGSIYNSNRCPKAQVRRQIGMTHCECCRRRSAWQRSKRHAVGATTDHETVFTGL
jgi:magnesium chelatase family protein